MEFKKQIECNVSLPINYELIGEGDDLLILLHGYTQTYERIKSRLWPAIESFQGRILSVSGPFLIPQKTSEGYQEGYSWYFYHAPSDHYIVPMDYSISAIQKIIQKEDLQSLSKIIIGYSQGGYLAPFAAEKLSNIKKVIGINSRFRNEERDAPFPFPLIGIHSSGDDVVEMSHSRDSFKALEKLGQKGEFLELEGGHHGIDETILETLKSLII